MWKKAVMVAVVTAGLVSAGYAQEIGVTVDGKALEFKDQMPVIQDGRTLVPLRSVFEAIGASVDWDETTRTITAKKRFDVVSLEIDSKDLYKNGERVAEMTVPAQILNGRTMVPARYVAEAFNASVKWEEDKQLVTVETLQHAHKINDVYHVESLKNADGTKTLLNIKYSYPVIENDEQSAAIDTINEALKNYAESWVVAVKNEIEVSSHLESAEEFAKEPYEYELAFDITEDEEGLLSVVYRCVTYTGGAHPNSWKEGMTYSFETGEKMGLPEIFNMTEEAVMYSIERFFAGLVEEEPEKFYENALELIPTAMEKVQYYVSGETVIFFLNPYEIAPYATGYVELVIQRP